MNELLLTDDGSHTIHSSRFQSSYHSKHGAIQEAQTVFIDAAFMPVVARQNHLDILEIGLGTGLNALMTCLKMSEFPQCTLCYTALEAFPVAPEMIATLNFSDCLSARDEAKKIFTFIHQTTWEEAHAFSPQIILQKKQQDFQSLTAENAFDIIYYDAFAPNSQPELWTIDIFEKMYRALRSKGILTTYCAKGEVKRNLRAAGFRVENLPGPIGKREMTRAVKE